MEQLRFVFNQSSIAGVIRALTLTFSLNGPQDEQWPLLYGHCILISPDSWVPRTRCVVEFHWGRSSRYPERSSARGTGCSPCSRHLVTISIATTRSSRRLYRTRTWRPGNGAATLHYAARWRDLLLHYAARWRKSVSVVSPSRDDWRKSASQTSMSTFWVIRNKNKSSRHNDMKLTPWIKKAFDRFWLELYMSVVS